MVFTTTLDTKLGKDVLENCALLRSHIQQIRVASNLNPEEPVNDDSKGLYPTEQVRPVDVGLAIRARVGNYHLGEYMSGPRTREAGITAETWAFIASGAKMLTMHAKDWTYIRALSDVGIHINDNAPPYKGSAPALLEALPGLLEAIGDLLQVAEQKPTLRTAPSKVRMAAKMLSPIWAKFVEHHLVPSQVDK